MRVAGYTATIVPTDSNAKEVGQPLAMKAAPNLGPNVMEVHTASTEEPTSAAPLHFKLHVTVAQGAKDWTSDWDFTHYSRETANPPARPVTVATAAPAATTSPAAASPVAPAGATAGSAEVSGVGPVTPDPVPPTTAGLLAELKTHADSVSQLLNDGNLGGLWVDALRSKDLAIALEQQHGSELPAAARPQLASAVKEMTRSAWEIDAAGDLGQRDKIAELQQVFAAAAANIQDLYASARH
jgi:hypothetical protein